MATISAKDFFGDAPAPKNNILDSFATEDAKMKSSFLGKVQEDIATRQSNIDASKARTVSGQQSILSGGLQRLGQGAGLIGDVAGDALSSIVGDKVSKKASDVASGVIGPVAQKISQIPAVQSLVETYKNADEVTKKNLDAVFNIASFVPVTKIVGTGAKTLAKGVAEGVDLGFDTAKIVSKETGDLAGRGIESVGKKIQQSVIRPVKRDIEDGFKIENVAKYDLGGDLPTTITKGHVKMNELSKQLQTTLKATDNKVDLNAAVEATKKKLLEGKGKNFGDNQAIDRVIQSLNDEVKSVSDNGIVDLVEATNIKRGAGTKGSWAYNRPEPDASAIEKVYTEFYGVLKNEIEKQAPEGVREINKQLSEIIPIYNAAIRRLPVEQRNNALSLTDNIGLFSSVFDPKALLLVGATKAARSGKVGDVLVKTGKALQKKD